MRQAGSVRARLLRLALLLVLPGLAISGFLTWRIFVTARQGADTALLATARGLDQLVDREFVQAEVLLRTLAATDDLRLGRIEAFDRLARATAMHNSSIVLIDAAGRPLVDTARAAGPAASALPEASLAQPSLAQPSLGQATISAMGAPDATGVPAARVVLPVYAAGRHAYDLALVMPAAEMQSLLLRDPLPAGWTASITDTADTTVASTRELQRYVGSWAGQGLPGELSRGAEAVREGRSSDGTPVVVAFSRSVLSGWTVAVASPRLLIAAAGRRSTVELVWLEAVAIAIGLVGALYVARGIARPIEAMARAAQSLGEGGGWTAIPQGLSEADAVARAMFEAFQFLMERREALGALNVSLATRVEARTSELARANAALEEQRRQLGDILNNMQVGVVVHHADGRLRFINREARRLLRLPMQGRIELTDWPVLHRGASVLTAEEDPSARARAGQPVQRELLTLHPQSGEDQDRPTVELEVNASPLRDQDGPVKLAVTTLQDVTARLEAEEARRRSQRLEAVGQLTGGVAHEFNNLLMAVSGCLELLTPYVDTAFGHGSRARSLLANALRATGRGAGLTGQLLAFARRQHLSVEPVDLNQLVGGMSQLMEGTLGRLVEVEILADEEVWPALADAAQLELALLNLAINARDAMPGGGRLIIRTANARTGAAMRAEDPPAGEYAVLHVSDTGHGMSPHVLARVFEPFYTTKEVGRGSGLGLPHVLGVAQQLGGGVRIASQPGQGTTVSLYLPRVRTGKPVARPPLQPQTAKQALSGARLLLVDDDLDVREIARSMLEELGAEVIEADSAAGALLLLRTGRVDLVLADLTMPHMSGIELAAEVVAMFPSMPVVLMTGYGPAAMDDAGPHVRATLRKPFRAEVLARTLAAELGLAEA